MARQENPPFQRGETFFGGDTPNTTDGDNILGKEWLFEDVGQGTVSANTGGYVRCRAVRNTSGTTIYAKRLVQISTTAGEFGECVDNAPATLAGEKAYPVDEYLPSSGVQDDDICWIVVDGPATVLTSLAAGAENVFSVGTPVFASTAATSGATTAGRAAAGATTGATNVLLQWAVNRVGKAMSAATTANTNSDLRVWVSSV